MESGWVVVLEVQFPLETKPLTESSATKIASEIQGTGEFLMRIDPNRPRFSCVMSIEGTTEAEALHSAHLLMHEACKQAGIGNWRQVSRQVIELTENSLFHHQPALELLGLASIQASYSLN